MITALMNDTVTIVRLSDGAIDEYGRPSRDEAARVESSARIEQRASRENEAFVIDTWRIALPAQTEIDAGDEVEYQGKRFSVINAPDNLSIPGFSALDRVEVDLKFVGTIDAAS
jgi:hypothetical protein